MNILGNYKSNLQAHLKNSDVLRVLAEKMKAGSLIRTDIEPQAKGVVVSINVVGDNGEDLYFSEKTALNTDSVEIISQTIKNWLEEYE